MQRYEVLGKRIGRFRCVSIRGTDEPTFDSCLSGARGEIWERGDGTLKAFKVTGGGNEKIFSFPFNDLEKWIVLLQVPASPSDQLQWVNNPNRRHEQ